jgi:hypothetical protein
MFPVGMSLRDHRGGLAMRWAAVAVGLLGLAIPNRADACAG